MSKQLFVDSLILLTHFCIVNIINFRGDLTDVAAKKSFTGGRTSFLFTRLTHTAARGNFDVKPSLLFSCIVKSMV